MLFALAVLFALLLAIYVLTEPDANQPATPRPLLYVIEGLDAADITLVRVERTADSTSTLLERDAAGDWVIASTVNYREAPADDGTMQELLTDQQAAQRVAGYLTTLTRREGFSAQEGDADLEGFGLLPGPRYVVRFETRDGTSRTLDIGATNPQGNAYYVRVRGEPTIYLALKPAIDGLIGIIEAPPYLAQTPTPSPAESD